MRTMVNMVLLGMFLLCIHLAVGQDDFLEEENRFKDTQSVSNSTIFMSSSWATGFCGSLKVVNPVDPAAIWNATLHIHTTTFTVIDTVWGDAGEMETTATDTGSSNVLIPEKDKAVKMVDEVVEINACMGVITDFVVIGQNLSDYLPGLDLQLEVDFTYDALEIRKLGFEVPPRYICSLDQCAAPDCFCASEAPPILPDGTPLNPRRVPQFVVVTIDGSVTDHSWNLFTKSMVESNIRDALDCRPRFTFFISQAYTNPHNVQTLHFMGQELGLRSLDGEIQTGTSVQEWGQQVQAGYFWMERLVSGVTREEIRGFRAPSLQYNEKLFTALRRQNLTYDSSFVPKEGRYWPFTLDAGAPDCLTAEKCPLPTTGLWEFPLNYMTGDAYPDDASARWAIDPTPGDGSAEAIRDMLALNFDQHYRGKRAPFSVNINSGWVVAGNSEKQNRAQGILEFLKLASTHQDVVFASPKQVISWMQNPTTDLIELSAREDFECPKFPWPVKRTERTCDGRDDDGNGLVDEHLVQSCRYKFPDLSFSTCKRCPRIYPNLEGPPIEDCQLDPDTVVWWCERNGGYELGESASIDLNGTLVDLPDAIMERIAAAWDQCRIGDNACQQSRADLLAEGSVVHLSDNEEVTNNFTLLPQGTTVANLTGKLNDTTWSISDIQYNSSGILPHVVVEVLERAAFNITPYVNPEKLQVFFQGRFFYPRRGPSVNMLGSISVLEENVTFTAVGDFNYALFAPNIPTIDPSTLDKDPEDGADDEDYDYDDDSGDAPPPGMGFEPDISPPPAPETKDLNSQADSAVMSMGVLILLLSHLFPYIF